MKKLTYKEAYDKITEAYIKGDIKPLDSCFCFCGTLHGGHGWSVGDNQYSRIEYGRMEFALFSSFPGLKYNSVCNLQCFSAKDDSEDFEENLFNGMCRALEVLKQIHKERGEDVDGVQEFTKRKLDKVISD